MSSCKLVLCFVPCVCSINSLRSLAMDLDEGLSLHLEEFARELDNNDHSGGDHNGHGNGKQAGGADGDGDFEDEYDDCDDDDADVDADGSSNR